MNPTAGSYVAMNRFRVSSGRQEEFETAWRDRETYLDEVEGIQGFALLRGAPAGGVTIYVSHSVWVSRAAFEAWTRSDAFAKAHREARLPQGVLLGHPEFDGYEVVDLTRR